jgi:mono/diheme cytochrome c family protein
MIRFLFVFFLAASCAPKSSNSDNNLAAISDSEVMQYAIPGKTLYENYCGNCHQADGMGLGKLIPPLKDADYFRTDIARSVWIMRNGLVGEVIVNGETYNQPMPGNPQLKPLEIAQISTYLYNIWGMNEGVITSSMVEGYLKKNPFDKD